MSSKIFRYRNKIVLSMRVQLTNEFPLHTLWTSAASFIDTIVISDLFLINNTTCTVHFSIKPYFSPWYARLRRRARPQAINACLASGNRKKVLVGDGQGKGGKKKTKLRNTTRAGLETRLQDRGRVWNASNGIVPPTATFYSISTLTRACRRVRVARACTRSREEVCAGQAVGDKRPVRCVLSINFELTAWPEGRIPLVVEVVPDDAESGVGASGIRRPRVTTTTLTTTLLSRAVRGRRNFPPRARRTSADQTVDGCNNVSTAEIAFHTINSRRVGKII